MEIIKKKATWKITAKPFQLGRLKAEDTWERFHFQSLVGDPECFFKDVIKVSILIGRGQVGKLSWNFLLQEIKIIVLI